jgi:serine protease Do/serine protease DegQ
MHSLIETGTVARGYLGVTTNQSLTPDMAESFGAPRDTKGMPITDLPEDGPAAKAGLKREDIITAIDGKPVSSGEELRMMIAQTTPGTKITVKYLRDGKPHTADVTLAKRPDDDVPAGELLAGVTIETLTPDLRKQLRIDERVDGMVITGIDEKSPYQENFREGMIIAELNRIPVTDLGTAKKALREGRNIARVYTRSGYRFVIFYVH